MTHNLFDDQPNLKSAIYSAIGAASVCWEERPHSNFDPEQASEIAESLMQWIVDNDQKLALDERDGVIIYQGNRYYRDYLEIKND